MMMQNSLQSRRWLDFRRRVEFAPDSVYTHRSCGWQYIPIHPFADELEDLPRGDMAPQKCWEVDAWWGIEEDATLVQVFITSFAQWPTGLYARKSEREERWVYLVAVLDATAVTRDAFEAVLSRFASLGFPGEERFQLTRHVGLTRLASMYA